MENQIKIENAVAAIRVSSIKQGLQGDSPDDQQKQIERFAAIHNINIKKYFVFLESASKEVQPLQEAVDYCKNPKNDIQLVLIKSIDRFTRGGSFFYEELKMQLVKHKIKLVDLYGIIGNQQVNTLDHLGIEFNWSIYSPTKKAEILEAERAKDEIRDILTRMIGAEIRYVRMGYRVRPAPYGFMNEKIETEHGKRVILKPHPEEAQYIIKMFELRARKTMTDREIVEEVNKLGYKSRIHYIRSPRDRLEVIGKRGGNKLTLKSFWAYIARPIYAGINDEKWTDPEPVKTKFPGLISVDVFNAANRGKIVLTEKDGGVTIYKNKPEAWRLIKKFKNPEYPYKRNVLCPVCNASLYGSASKGKSGGHFPVYHCDRHKRFSVPVKTFNETIETFVKGLRVTDEGVKKFKEAVLTGWEQRVEGGKKEVENIDQKIQALETQKTLIGNKIAILTSDEAIKLMEDKLKEITSDINDLRQAQAKQDNKNINMEMISEVVGYFLEHHDFLLLGSPNRLKRASYFGLVFTQTPTYQELVSRTTKLAPYIKLIDELSNPLVRDCEPAGDRTQDQEIKSLLLYR